MDLEWQRETGMSDGMTDERLCFHCGGTGTMMMARVAGGELFPETCPWCEGRGQVEADARKRLEADAPNTEEDEVVLLNISAKDAQVGGIMVAGIVSCMLEDNNGGCSIDGTPPEVICLLESALSSVRGWSSATAKPP